jgi:RNA recognition motif-containing protein
MEKAKKDQNIEERRLWIGNLDPRVTEYHLLKLVQKHGAIEKFDLLFHRTGPLAGQPRGYAFVTYRNKEDALRAKEILNNALVGQRSIMVTWAYSVNNDEVEKPRPEINIPALAMSKNEKKTDRESQIQAIEAKLKLMEKKSEDELKINDTVATKPPVITQFQYNKQGITNNNLKTKTILKRHDKFNKPYNKLKSNR